MVNKYTDLEAYFKTTEKDAVRFIDTISDIVQKEGGGAHEDYVVRQLVSGKPDRVKTPKRFAVHLSGFVRIFCGWHSSDYVWHIEHAAIRRQWKVSDAKVIHMISMIMHDHLPDIEAKIWTPQPDWELRTITFKAVGLANFWNFEESTVDKINSKLFEVLNTVV